MSPCLLRSKLAGIAGAFEHFIFIPPPVFFISFLIKRFIYGHNGIIHSFFPRLDPPIDAMVSRQQAVAHQFAP